jgi:hypothetical protein
MAAVKSIPIHDEEGKVLAYRFQASNAFTDALKKNYVEMRGPNGKVVSVNKKLAGSGLYADKGFEPAAVEPATKRAKDAN